MSVAELFVDRKDKAMVRAAENRPSVILRGYDGPNAEGEIVRMGFWAYPHPDESGEMVLDAGVFDYETARLQAVERANKAGVPFVEVIDDISEV